MRLRSFAEGHPIEALDLQQLWYPASIVSTQGDQVLVSFDGWPSEWDEWMPKDSARLSEHRGWGTSQMPEDWQQHDTIEALDMNMKWCKAKVLHVAEHSVKVHYIGWAGTT